MTYPAGEWVQFGVGGPTLSKSGSMIASSAPITVFGLPVTNGATATGGQLSFWSGTKAQYDAIATKSASTIYVVTAVTAVTGDITVDEGAETGDIAVEPEPAEEPATRSATTKTTRAKK